MCLPLTLIISSAANAVRKALVDHPAFSDGSPAPGKGLDKLLASSPVSEKGGVSPFLIVTPDGKSPALIGLNPTWLWGEVESG